MIQFFKDIYRNRELLVRFSWNDFKARFAGSFLGVFWAFVNPLVTIGVYWFVFGVGLKAGMTNGNIPFVVYLVTGIIAWFFFSDTLMAATNCYREYTYLVKKVVFDIRILPTSKLMANLYTHVFFIFIAIILSALYGFYPTIKLIQIFYYVFCLIMFLTGLTWITASIQPFFADLSQIINVFMQILMWGTPILWSMGIFPARFDTMFKLNPLFYIVQGYRDSFLNGPWFWQYDTMSLYFWVFTLLLLIIGSKVYNRLSPHFSDVL